MKPAEVSRGKKNISHHLKKHPIGFRRDRRQAGSFPAPGDREKTRGDGIMSRRQWLRRMSLLVAPERTFGQTVMSLSEQTGSGQPIVRRRFSTQGTSIQSDLLAQSVLQQCRRDEMVTALDLRSKLDAKVHQPHKSERRVPPGNKFAIPIGKRLNQNQRNTIALTVAKW
jgi:hypothetical protein